MKKTLTILFFIALLSACDNGNASNISSSMPVSANEEEISKPQNEMQAESSQANSSELSSVLSSSISEAPLSSSETDIQSSFVVEENHWWNTKLQKLYLTDELWHEQARFIYNDNDLKLSHSFLHVFSVGGYGSEGQERSIELLENTIQDNDIGEPILDGDFMELVTIEDEKFSIYFYENGIELIHSDRGEGYGERVKLSLPENDYKQILNNIESEIHMKELWYLEYNDGEKWGYPQWLSMMRPSRIENLTCYSRDMEHVKDYGAYEDMLSLPYIFRDLSDFWVKDMQFTENKSLENSAKAVIKFNNGLVYEVYENETQLLIYASDIDSALVYEKRSDIILLDKYAQGHLNPPTG